MNTQQLSPETIATLAEFLGWKKGRTKAGNIYWASIEGVVIWDAELSEHFTDLLTLMRLRNDLIEKANEKDIFILDLYDEVGGLILKGLNHAAAEKAAEIIQKLKG